MLRYVGLFLLWNLAVSATLIALPPLPALAVAVVLTLVFVHGVLLRHRRQRRHWLALRLRPLRGEALRAVLLSILPFLLFNWALGEVYVRLVPVPPEVFRPFSALMREPAGRLAVTVLAIGFAPLIEELVFRGLIQGRLERRRSAGYAITVAAALFALIHFLPWVLPLHFFLGAAFGFAVYATRSVWAGVVLHAANNVAAVVGFGLQSAGEERTATVWETGVTPEWWLYAGSLLLAGAALGWVGHRVWRVGRGARLRRVSARA